MSTPENILSKYRTHSYHHILIATIDSDAVAGLSKAPIEAFMRSTDDRFEADKLAGSSYSNGKPYVVLINSMIDSDYIIDDVEWSNVIAQLPEYEKDNHAAAVSQATEGKLKILEPKGARFMELMSTVFDELQCEPTGIQFVLKTIFIGHTDDTASTKGGVEALTNIDPFVFMMWNFQASHTEMGSTYQMDVIGMANGASKTPQYMSIVDGFTSFQVKDDLTLFTGNSGVFTDFTAALNTQYGVQLEIVSKDLAKKGLSLDQVGKKVRYVITTHEWYQKDRYKLDAINPQRTAGNDGKKGVHLNFPNHFTIEECVYDILRQCKAIQEDASAESGTFTYAPKVHTSVVTVDDGDVGYEVRYFIAPYMVADRSLNEALLRNDHSAFEPGGKYADSLITFDYLFTGKNVDVLDFDMKVEMGMMYFQMAKPNHNITDSGNQLNDSIQPQGDEQNGNISLTSGAKVDTISQRKNTPLFASKHLYDKLIAHTPTPQGAARFDDALRQHAAYEALDSTLRIIGNPALLSDMTQLPTDIGQHSSSTDDTPMMLNSVSQNEKESNLGRHFAQKWQTHPVVVKVDVKMSREGENGEMIYEPFWYKGYFRIIAIKHEFSKGEFTQTLELLSSIVDDGSGMSSVTPSDKPTGNSVPGNMQKDITIAPCDLTGLDINNIDYNYQLSTYFKLGDLTTGVALNSPTDTARGKNAVVNNKGRTKEEIICNLQHLTSELDKIKAKYPTMIITSGFRANQNTSQHNIGQAADLQFPGTSGSEYKSIAEWIQANTNFDQLILEYQTSGTRLPWIHFSYTGGSNNRKQIFTMKNHYRYKQFGIFYPYNEAMIYG